MTTETIENLYRAFSDTERPSDISRCSCCMAPSWIGELLTTPLKEISDSTVLSFVAEAFQDVGGAEDYHYYFPRAFDAAASNAGYWPDFSVVLAKLKKAKWKSWPEAHRDAVIAAIAAQFDNVLSGQSQSNLQELLFGIAASGLDLEPYFARIASASDNRAVREFALDMAEYPAGEAPLDSPWAEEPEALKSITQWLAASSVTTAPHI